METIQAIKPGPKPKKDNGEDDKRRRVLPETKLGDKFCFMSDRKN